MGRSFRLKITIPPTYPITDIPMRIRHGTQLRLPVFTISAGERREYRDMSDNHENLSPSCPIIFMRKNAMGIPAPKVKDFPESLNMHEAQNDIALKDMKVTQEERVMSMNAPISSSPGNII